MDHPTRLYVPATLANLGSGFDALGVALDLYLEVEAEPAPKDAFHYEGEGDVLSGAIAALLAAGLRPSDAARLGVYLHGLAGDLLAEEKGVGLLAREVAEALPRARRLLQEGRVPPAFLLR
ncbi:MAG: NAD(P)H-hydrate dehydratase [Thermus sp.]|nr:NAD(P)H-hydrate dehydratase [Thermus sp.]